MKKEARNNGNDVEFVPVICRISKEKNNEEDDCTVAFSRCAVARLLARLLARSRTYNKYLHDFLLVFCVYFPVRIMHFSWLCVCMCVY